MGCGGDRGGRCRGGGGCDFGAPWVAGFAGGEIELAAGESLWGVPDGECGQRAERCGDSAAGRSYAGDSEGFLACGGKHAVDADSGGDWGAASDLDAAIVSEAVRRGCEFVSGATAGVLPASREDGFREINLQTGKVSRIIRARAVLACDGIGGTSLGRIGWAKWEIARNSRIGVAGTCDGADWAIETGEIHMHVGKAGYVGLVRFNDKCVHLAAALDPAACRAREGRGKLFDGF